MSEESATYVLDNAWVESRRRLTLLEEVLALSLIQVRPLVLAAGATEADLDEMSRRLADPNQWFPGWAMMSVRGQAPNR